MERIETGFNFALFCEVLRGSYAKPWRFLNCGVLGLVSIDDFSNLSSWESVMVKQ